MTPDSLVLTFICLGLFCLAIYHLLPAPAASMVAVIIAAVLFLVATILTLIPGHV